jgi:hypothetical protein
MQYKVLQLHCCMTQPIAICLFVESYLQPAAQPLCRTSFSEQHAMGCLLLHLSATAGALFSIPRIRYMLPGNIPAGMLVDIFGFGWATVMIGCGFLLMISLYVGQYSHKAKLFQMEKKTS